MFSLGLHKSLLNTKWRTHPFIFLSFFLPLSNFQVVWKKKKFYTSSFGLMWRKKKILDGHLTVVVDATNLADSLLFKWDTESLELEK